jgi:hypothetical protein
MEVDRTLRQEVRQCRACRGLALRVVEGCRACRWTQTSRKTRTNRVAVAISCLWTKPSTWLTRHAELVMELGRVDGLTSVSL